MEQWLANLYNNKPRQMQAQGGQPGQFQGRPQHFHQRSVTYLDNFQKIKTVHHDTQDTLIPIFFDLEFEG